MAQNLASQRNSLRRNPLRNYTAYFQQCFQTLCMVDPCSNFLKFIKK